MIYTEGTVDVTNGSAIVTGVGTKFIANTKAGDVFIRKGDLAVYYVASNPVSDISLTLTGNYGGITGTGLAYGVIRDFTDPDGIPFPNQGDVETATILKEAILKIQSLIVGLRQVTVEAKTANHTITVDETRKLFTNEGAAGQVDFAFPPAAAGLDVSFFVHTAQPMKLIANAGNTLRPGPSGTVPVSDITLNTVGDWISFYAINDTEWVENNSKGGVAAAVPGNQNAIINGNFNINQRAVSGTVILAAGEYGHDRFKAGASGCTYTFVTSENVTTITITAGSLIQVIEGTNLFSGTYVLSWVGTAQGKIDAGAFSASGVTGTATGGTNMTVEFNTGTLSKVQLEPGSVATNFVYRGVGEEFALCQRYLPAFNGQPFSLSGHAKSTTQAFLVVPFPVTARVKPTGITTVGTAFQLMNAAGSGIPITVIVLNFANPENAMLLVTVASGLVAGNAATFFSSESNAQILFTGCEL